MGVVIPQVVTEDRAGGAQIVDGGLRFDGSKSQYLSRTFGSGSQTTWTWAGWVKRNKTAAVADVLFSANYSSGLDARISFSSTDTIYYSDGGGPAGTLETTAVYRDFSSWMHIVFVYDSSNGTSTDRLRLYVNGSRVTAFGTATYPNSSVSSSFNGNKSHTIGQFASVFGYYINTYLSTVYFIDGAALDPSYFGYTDPLTNVWRPKKLDITKTPGASYGTNGFYLPFDGSAPIGQDQSGRGNNWTPVNFGGSNTIEKATGALPILNTDGGGKIARVGVRTDANASSLVLALPLVGISSDFSNRINSGTSNKDITNTSVTFSSSYSNFYGGSSYFNGSAYLRAPAGTDFTYGTGDFTFEGWIYPTASADQVIYGQTSSGNNFINIALTPTTNYLSAQINSSGAGNNVTSTIPVTLNTWNHIAVTRESTVVKLYINGVLGGSGTRNVDLSLASIQPSIGTYSHTSSLNFTGYIQDFRIYKGVAKYTSNFIPASTDPDIVPDSPSGVSYSSNVALVPSTDGAVAFGSGKVLTTTSSADFNFGTPSGNTNDFTVEYFLYRNSLGSNDAAVTNYSQVSSGYFFCIHSNSTDAYFGLNGSTVCSGGTAEKGKWIHYAFVRSGTTCTIYKDGISIASATSSAQAGATNVMNIGAYSDGSSYIDGFVSNLHVVKGTALYTSNFTPPTAPITSVANTKLLCCKSQTSATAADVTPGTITANGNAAATNFNPFTVNINTQRGQESGYCTLNPLDQAGSNTFSNGNLNTVVAADNNAPPTVVCGSSAVSSGKWYWEVDQIAATTAGGMIGVGDCGVSVSFRSWRSTGGWYYYGNSGQKYNNGSGATYGSSYTTNDTISVVLDMDVGSISFYKNGVNQGVAYNTGLSGKTIVPSLANGTGGGTQSYAANFGQKPFKFPPPAGFQPLTLANTPRPTIVRPDQFVGIVTYKGNGSALAVNVGFQPDFVWCKIRTPNSYNHTLLDSVRGFTKSLSSSMTVQEYTEPTGPVAITPTGFTLNGDVTYVGSVNQNNSDYVAWAWKAGGNSKTFNIDGVGYDTASAAGLTAGTITPTGASVNTKSGFSIIGYTGTGATGGTISHGLGKPPAFIIAKSRSASRDWIVYHKDLTKDKYINLNLLPGASSTTSVWGSAEPTSSVFGVYAWSTAQNNANGENIIAYCWAEIPGFSKFGSFSGNNSTDGPVVICGFRPRWIMVKRTDSASVSYGWFIVDTTRSPNNGVFKWLAADNLIAEQTESTPLFDILSNGFKVRTNAANINASSGGTYIYAAWAETPSINLYGAQANAR